MAIPVNMQAYKAPASHWQQHTYAPTANYTTPKIQNQQNVNTSGTQAANAMSGAPVGMYAGIAQTAFNSTFGAITKPKAAALEAANLVSNAKLQRQADIFNIAQMRKYADDFKGQALKSFLSQMKESSSFIGTQKAVMSANGNWYGTTFDAFVDDSVQKTNADIKEKSGIVDTQVAQIKMQAQMYDLQSKLNLETAQNQASSIRKIGQYQGIMSMLGVGQ